MPHRGSERLRSEWNRRRYLQWLGLGGAAGLAGCVGGDGGTTATPAADDETEPGDEAPEEEQTPKPSPEPGTDRYGGHLIDAGRSAPQTLNPHKGAGLGDIIVSDFMYSRLTQVDHEVNLQPDLAVEWTANDAVDEWTFVLREGAKFVTGQEVLAQDVKATVDILRSDRVPGGGRSLYSTENVEVEDDYRIRFDLAEPDTQLPFKFAEINNKLMIVPEELKGEYDRLTDEDVGSGSLVLEDFQKGSFYRFTAFDDYYEKEWLVENPVPYVDELTYKIVTDPISQINQLAEREVDVLHIPKAKVKSRAGQLDYVKFKQKPTARFANVVLNTKLEWFKDNRVRQAIKYAIDHEALATAMAEAATAAFHHPIAPIHPHFDDGIDDPFGPGAKVEKAKQLLEEAGYPDGIELPPLWIKNTNIEEASVFQNQMRKVGLTFELKNQPYDTWITETWFSDDRWYFSGWSARVSELTVINLAWVTGGKWNTGFWEHEEFTSLIEQAMSTTDDAKLQNLLTQAQQIAHLEGPWLVIGFVKAPWVHNDYVRNAEPTGARAFDWLSEFAWLTEDAPAR